MNFGGVRDPSNLREPGGGNPFSAEDNWKWAYVHMQKCTLSYVKLTASLEILILLIINAKMCTICKMDKQTHLVCQELWHTHIAVEVLQVH